MSNPAFPASCEDHNSEPKDGHYILTPKAGRIEQFQTVVTDAMQSHDVLVIRGRQERETRHGYTDMLVVKLI